MACCSAVFEGYFALPSKRRRKRRANQVRAPALQAQIIQHIEEDGPHEYTLVKERRQPRSTPQKTRKQVGKRGGRRGVGRCTIIDIHLEVLDECQKKDLHSTKEDFFEILIQEFMGSEFMKEEKIPKEQVASSDFGFMEDDFVPKEEIHK
ncbi:SICA antigen [Plasmodium coatneyi]|uniref:SICA antigen n=1 Tax=Plasmodium coatneyi TaxID=208452 RepID=A0A1B1E752_9APIC|nr:SICA antigen [Plasmodium coatneyi]ANQ10828.1 SICA antigen [Plasmodium coatneyi]